MPSLTPPEDPGNLTTPGNRGDLTPPGNRGDLTPPEGLGKLTPPETPVAPENPESRDPGPGSGLTLLTRLWQRAEQPGCVQHSQTRAILARHQRMTGEPPLAELLLRRGTGWADIAPARPVITNARPASPDPAPGPARPPGAPTSPAGASAPPTARARRRQPHDPPFPPPATVRPVRSTGTAAADPGSRTVPRRPAGYGSPEPPAPHPVIPRSPLPGGALGTPPRAARGAAAETVSRTAQGTAPATAPRTPPKPAPATRPLTDTTGPLTDTTGPLTETPRPATPATIRPRLPLPPAPVTARPATSANHRDQPDSRPPADARQGSSPVTVPAPSRPAFPVPRHPARPGDIGPRPPQNLRPVVRPGSGHRDPQPATLAWPAPGRRADSRRRSVPVVREQPPPGAWRPAPQRPRKFPAATPAAPAPAPADLAGLVAAAVARQNQAGRAAPRTAGSRTAGSRTPPPEQPARRPPAPPLRDREPARPAVDVNRIVSTVQRRFMHQLAIERERRGMMP